MCLAAVLAALLLAWPAGWALADEQTDSATTEVYLAPGNSQDTQSASLGGGTTTAATTNNAGTSTKSGTSAKTGDGVPAAPVAAAAYAAAAVAGAAFVAKRRAASNGAVGGGDPR